MWRKRHDASVATGTAVGLKMRLRIQPTLGQPASQLPRLKLGEWHFAGIGGREAFHLAAFVVSAAAGEGKVSRFQVFVMRRDMLLEQGIIFVASLMAIQVLPNIIQGLLVASLRLAVIIMSHRLYNFFPGFLCG